MSGFYFLEIKKKISRVSKEAVKEKKKGFWQHVLHKKF